MSSWLQASSHRAILERVVTFCQDQAVQFLRTVSQTPGAALVSSAVSSDACVKWVGGLSGSSGMLLEATTDFLRPSQEDMVSARNMRRLASEASAMGMQSGRATGTASGMCTPALLRFSPHDTAIPTSLGVSTDLPPNLTLLRSLQPGGSSTQFAYSSPSGLALLLFTLCNPPPSADGVSLETGKRRWKQPTKYNPVVKEASDRILKHRRLEMKNPLATDEDGGPARDLHGGFDDHVWCVARLYTFLSPCCRELPINV